MSSKPPLPDAAHAPTQPVASSSRLPPPPSPLHNTCSLSTSPAETIPRIHSSSSGLSDASERTPLGPLTPPDAVQQFPLDRPLEYYDSPPSPPRSLQDQMHVAYALENMHLAKILLLKLRGIEVSGDDDPRIAAVRDEDFSSSFVPEGGLRLDAEAEARVQEAERRAREAQKRRERDARLRHCEWVFETSIRTFKAELQRVARAKEDAYRERRDAERRERERERERARKAEAARAARASQLRIGHTRRLLSYDALRNADARFPKPTHAKDKEDESGQFLYEIMPSPPRPLSLSLSPPSPSTSRSPTDREDLTLVRAQKEFVLKHAKSLSRSVPFSDVLTAMHGPLFAEDEHSRPYARCKPQQAELLAILLEPVVGERGKTRQEDAPPEPVLKPKNPAAARIARSSTIESVSSTSSETSSSASAVTRPSSWFSFGSKSSYRSTSTTLTTPSSSPLASSKPSILLSSPLSSSPPSDSPLRTHRQSSKPPISPVVPAVDHPLALSAPPKPKRREPLAIGRGRPLTRRLDTYNTQLDDLSPPPSPSGLAHRVTRSVSTFIDFASQLQRAYVKTTIFTASVDLYGRSPSRSTSRSPSRSPVRVRCSSDSRRYNGRMKPAGYRACSTDVQVFTALYVSPSEGEHRQYQRTLIPLCPPSTDTLAAHERVFPLPPPLPRSPFRPQFLPGVPMQRVRPVANPVLLRLQALHNVCQSRALKWHYARDGAMAAGKEKMVGIAWEGIGRSGLGWEVNAVCY
ncbi:hypothetical protein C8Q74DRAFT_1192810 [Fomes fomentarius]|nr:hypothetical protein C8Q74DRAFT_1192810 [Fomes fomentarius]